MAGKIFFLIGNSLDGRKGKQTGFRTSSVREAYVKRLVGGGGDGRRGSEVVCEGMENENEFSRFYK